MVKIIIRNHAQVARLYSRFAGLASTLAPGYLRKRVEEDFAIQLREQLAEYGLVADVIVEPDPPGPAKSA